MVPRRRKARSVQRRGRTPAAAGCPGQSCQRPRVPSMRTMPLMARRSSARHAPGRFAGNSGAIEAHCRSASQNRPPSSTLRPMRSSGRSTPRPGRNGRGLEPRSRPPAIQAGRRTRPDPCSRGPFSQCSVRSLPVLRASPRLQPLPRIGRRQRPRRSPSSSRRVPIGSRARSGTLLAVSWPGGTSTTEKKAPPHSTGAHPSQQVQGPTHERRDD